MLNQEERICFIMFRKMKQSKFKILFIAHEFPPFEGGMQTYAYELVSNLSTDNDVSVICRKDIEEGHIENVKIFPVLSETKNNDFFEDVENCINVIKDVNPDIIHILNAGFSIFTVHLKKELNIPVIVTAHGKDFMKPWVFPKADETEKKKLLLEGLNKADSIIAVSNYTKNKLLELGVKTNISVILNGCDPQKFHPKKKNQKILAKLNIKERDNLLLTVSRLMDRKGQDVVIKALPSVLKKYPNTKYILIGTQDFGYEEENLRNLARKLNLKKNIIFLGYVPDDNLIDYYNSCDIFILTPREIKTDNYIDAEGFGIVYLEAGSCEKPVIASNTGGVPEAVIDGETGILVEPENFEETANAIIRLLENSELGKKLGKNARKKVMEELNWKKISEKIFQIYHTISSSSYRA